MKKNYIFDGAMGTSLQNKGLIPGQIPEDWNIDKSEVIIDIHREYISSGANIITTNTFGANKFKKELFSYSLDEIISSAIDNSKFAITGSDTLIALDIGPIGKMIEPIGDLTFDKAYESFKEIILLANDRTDIILFETFSSLQELRAGILAAKENSKLPIFCTMTFDLSENTLTGTSPEIFAATAEALGASAIGVNCSLGPDKLVNIVKRLSDVSNLPIICQPNAGIPKIDNNKTYYDLPKEDFLNHMTKIVENGATIIGGCCGTTPEYIKTLTTINFNEKFQNKIDFYPLVSETQLVNTSKPPFIVGERINPSGNKKLKKQLLDSNIEFAIKEAILQQEAGAHFLDINTSLREIDEKNTMLDIIKNLRGIVDLPIQIDSIKADVIEEALRQYCGIAIINSVNGTESSLNSILPLAKKYGAHIIALTIDDKGIPKLAEERFEIACKIIERAKLMGIAEEKIIVDCLTLTVSAQQKEVMETIKAIKLIKSNYKCKTALGLSNVSFGLPNRSLINSTFLTIALNNGLDYIIANPLDNLIKETVLAYNVLSNNDMGSIEYTNYFNKNKVNTETVDIDENKEISIDLIYSYIKKGLSNELIESIEVLNKSLEPLEIINNYLIPSLKMIGEDFEKNIIFLPQLIRAAETITKGFDLVKLNLKSKDIINHKGNIILATVKGDIHDIGKNLVKVMLESFNFNVIDLGKDVSPELILEEARKTDIKLIGLSSLMTTTIENMEKTISLIQRENLACKIFVGGAVITEKIAQSINADYYCKDAMDSVRVAEKFFCKF